MVKFTIMVTGLLVAAFGALTTNLPGHQQSRVTPAAAHRQVEAQNSERWTEISIQLDAQQIALQAMADAREAEAARQAEAAAEQARQDELARQQGAAAAAAAVKPKPAAPPAAAPAPAPAPPAGSIQAIIVSACSPYGQATVDWCLRVAKCESGYNPNAVNGAGPYYGLFQFLTSTFSHTPYGNQNIFDPYYNAAAAAWKYSVSGGGAWGCK
ncbi:MAG TPA: transglycosylase SLT domain-containing protein [Candidatus Dormibacteraeota bacterium]